jgi:broad specificity phosphatase PhoE
VVRVWLIRHGQSESNAGLPSTDWRAIPLTTLGRRQAEHVAGVFADPPQFIVTSPYLRASQTAQPNCGVLEPRYYPGEPTPSLMGGSTPHLPASLAPQDRDEKRSASLT